MNTLLFLKVNRFLVSLVVWTIQSLLRGALKDLFRPVVCIVSGYTMSGADDVMHSYAINFTPHWQLAQVMQGDVSGFFPLCINLV